MALFESYERRIDKINAVLNSYGIASIEEAEKITKDAGLNVYDQIKGIQPICFENACWAYTVGAAIAIKKGCRKASEAAAAIGEGLQAFCIPGSVADTRKVGLGHGNLGKMLLDICSGEVTALDIPAGALAGGFLAAFVSGTLACKFMIEIVKRGKLIWFALYCAAAGLVSILSYIC